MFVHLVVIWILMFWKEDAFEYLPIHGGEILPYDSVDNKTDVDSLISHPRANAMNESEQ